MRKDVIRILPIILIITALLAWCPGCGGGSSSSRSGGGGGGGTGSGTGTGTGTGGNGGGGASNEYSFLWTVSGDATQSQLDGLKSRMQRLSDMLYQCGDGQQYIKSITIRDNATNGDIRTPLASISSTSLGGGSYGKTVMSGGVWHIELPGDPHPGLFAHEHGHFEWQLGEEYTASQGCPCVMANLSVGAQMQYCDSSNHNGAAFSQSPCWDTIRSKTNMEHTDGSYSGATSGPACEVTVENSGQ